MDPFIFGVVALVGASAAAAVRWRRARIAARAGGDKALPAPRRGRADERRDESGEDAVRVGDVLTYLGDEFWLAGELALVREGSAAIRLFSAPERGRERWIALPRDGRSVWVLYVDAAVAGLGWPGVEVPAEGRVLRRFEHGSAAITPAGEGTASWEGVGRFALFRAHDAVAVVVEGANKARLALVGREIPRQLVQKMG